MRTIKIVLGYDGTEFVGWQRQASGRSVQGVLEDALSRIEGQSVAVVGAGRTDAGVHALGQVASVRLTSGIRELSLQHALNATLPADVRAGVAGLQVVHCLLMGSPPLPHRGVESNVASFVVRPTITSQSAAANQVTVGVSPMVRAGQRVALLMNEWAAIPPPTTQAYRFDAKPPTSDTNTLQFAISGVKGGGTTYILRVQVDGAESPVDLDPGSINFGPTVTIT